MTTSSIQYSNTLSDLAQLSSRYVNSSIFKSDMTDFVRLSAPLLKFAEIASEVAAVNASSMRPIVDALSASIAPMDGMKALIQAYCVETSAIQKMISESGYTQMLENIKLIASNMKVFSDSDLQVMQNSMSTALNINPSITDSISKISSNLSAALINSSLNEQLVMMKGFINEAKFGDITVEQLGPEEDLDDLQILSEIQHGTDAIAANFGRGQIDGSIFEKMLIHPNPSVKAYFLKIFKWILIQLVSMSFMLCISPQFTNILNTNTAAISRAMDKFCIDQAKNQETPQKFVTLFSKLRYVNVTMLTLRSNRSRSAPAVYDMTYGSQVKIVKFHKEWVQIRLNLGDEILEGWVQKKYLAKYDYWAIKLEWAYRNVSRNDLSEQITETVLPTLGK